MTIIKKEHICMIVCTIIIVLLTAGTMIGLAMIIKYAYIDQLMHYHTDTCYINNCSSTESQCRGSIRSHTTYTCYAIKVNYDLILLNNTNNANDTNIYTKTSEEYDSRTNDCDQTTIICYYNDRNILETLRPWNRYDASLGLYGIVMMSILLFFVILLSLIGIPLIWGSFIENENEIEIEMSELPK